MAFVVYEIGVPANGQSVLKGGGSKKIMPKMSALAPNVVGDV